MTPRCTVPGSPTCVLPGVATDSHRCVHCGRVWRAVKNQRGQPYWRWNGTEYAKKVSP